ncbi:MAG: photosystem II protein PsbQ [Leptolyngbyaceae cyanobacterium bins.302]|nr:photosystem II protein PsbQ [Leptolyngbyaceae cyanobacterium bins.302]
MVNYRSILAMFLALVTALMLNVGSVEAAKVKKPLTYTSDQLEQLGVYTADLQEMRDRLPELGTLINKKDWTFTRNFIHGPLGELRVQMSNVARTLLPDAQPVAKKLAKEVFDDLVAIDLAAQNQNFQTAIKKYAEALKDFDAFLGLVPEAARSSSAA